VLAARYAAALAGWDGEVTDEFRRKLRMLRGLCQDIVELRRGNHSGAAQPGAGTTGTGTGKNGGRSRGTFQALGEKPRGARLDMSGLAESRGA